MEIHVGMDDLHTHTKEYLEYIEAELEKEEKERGEMIVKKMDLNNDLISVYNATDLKQLTYRSSTEGYQPKYFTRDRKTFIKAQASISGVFMNDWKVELLASDICEHWKIPHVKQIPCKIITKSGELHAVKSRSFEQDGKTFQSFRSLLDYNYFSMEDDNFIKLDAVDKLKWCADKLSRLCNLEYIACETYMLDLAMLDIIVGNIDRHSKNYGVFFDTIHSCYEIALIFDNGMGLFENDYYRDNYKTYEDALHNVYIAPYGEDPFELVDLLASNFDLSKYNVTSLELNESYIPNDYAKRYLFEIIEKIRSVQ